MVNEVNFDGLVGMTHNYAGLGHGNLASQSSQGRSSSPRKAALEGLEKMALLMSLGVPQGVLPPHERPNLSFLRRCGFSGSDRNVFESAWKRAPHLARVALSASPMWVANAATITRDSGGQIDVTPANLAAQLHRAAEVDFTSRALRQIFSNPAIFRHHAPVFSQTELRDEGAANHMSLWQDDQRLEVFVYGFEQGAKGPKVHAPRQTRAASEAVARGHGLDGRALFLQQSPDAIDAGVFHNDVIAVSHQNFLFAHECAFVDGAFDQVRARLPGVEIEVVNQRDVSLEDAVKSYVFNSQLVTSSAGRVLIAPTQAAETPSVKAMLDKLVTQSVFSEVIFQPLHESMSNGGGPACLRLRVPITPADTLTQPCILDVERLDSLKSWVVKHYPDHLDVEALRDPTLIELAYQALDELTQILELGDFYDFQKDT